MPDPVSAAGIIGAVGNIPGIKRDSSSVAQARSDTFVDVVQDMNSPFIVGGGTPQSIQNTSPNGQSGLINFASGSKSNGVMMWVLIGLGGLLLWLLFLRKK